MRLEISKVNDENGPLLFFSQTSNKATSRELASSVPSQLPPPTSRRTERVSRTRLRVSSDVMSKNGPRSFVIRGTRSMIADSSAP